MPAAEALLAEAAERRHPAVHLFEADLQRAGVVVTACRGELDRACDEALAAAETARRWGQPVLQAAGLHLAGCLGSATEVAGPLTDLAAPLDAGLIAIFAAHVRAEAAEDPDALVAAADRFAAAGALLNAARTVESHLQHAFAKLGVTGRGDLAGMAVDSD